MDFVRSARDLDLGGVVEAARRDVLGEPPVELRLRGLPNGRRHPVAVDPLDALQELPEVRPDLRLRIRAVRDVVGAEGEEDEVWLDLGEERGVIGNGDIRRCRVSRNIHKGKDHEIILKK